MLSSQSVSNIENSNKVVTFKATQQPQSYYAPTAPIGRDYYESQNKVKQAKDKDKMLTNILKILGVTVLSLAGVYLGKEFIDKISINKMTKQHLSLQNSKLEAEIKRISNDIDTKNLFNEKIFEDLSDALSIDDLVLPDALRKTESIFMNNVEKSDKIYARGGKPVNTFLMYGPPGTGKTTFSKAMSKKIPGAHFISLDTSKMFDKYFGESEKNVTAMMDKICELADKFETKYKEDLAKIIGEDLVKSGNKKEIQKAINKALSEGKELPIKEKIIVLCDEIDSVMLVDKSDGVSTTNRVLNEFKKGFTEKLCKRDNIFVIGATNVDINVEKAMTKDGKTLDTAMLDRFSKKIYVPRPDINALEELMVRHYKKYEDVADVLKTKSSKTHAIAEFLYKKDISIRDMNYIYDEAASLSVDSSEKLCPMDIVEALKIKKDSLKITDTDINELIKKLS